MSGICGHFGVCGGCVAQDVPFADYIAAKRETVRGALAQAGLGDAVVEEAVPVPPQSRRRAVFKLKSLAEGLHIGFHAARSHSIVDMRQCEVLTPGLFVLVARLRPVLEPLFGAGEAAELHVAECVNGFDCAFRWKRRLTPALAGELSRALAGLGIARLMLGTETVFETAAPLVMFDGIAVKPPPYAFLQPTRVGEAALQARVVAHLAPARRIADLFCGCGTFALPLAARARVHAVEQDVQMLSALAAASHASGLKPVTTETRDLFKQPLLPAELGAYDAVCLDPPRAGAEAQARTLAASRIGRVAYVSCDPQSFARDAKILVEGGLRLGPVTPVDQFLWSAHIELVATFSRGSR